MPADFECSTCRLGFSIGTYHYHSFDDGFIGSTLLVCRETGRQHRLEIPHPDRPYDFALESMPRLLIDVPRVADTMLMLPDDDWSSRQAVSTREFSSLACHCCSQLGTLIDKIEPGVRCPNCHDVLPRPIAEWMT